MKTILIANQKGGIGKTTTAIELSSYLGQKYRVLGIDLDSQRHFGKYSGATLDTINAKGKAKEVVNILDVLNDDVDIRDAIQHIEQPKFLNKVVQFMLIDAEKKKLSQVKSLLKKECKNKLSYEKNVKPHEAATKKRVAEIKKEVYEQERQNTGFDIIPASSKLFNANMYFPEFDDIFKLCQKLEEVSDDYDFVIIDSAPARSILLNMSILAADYILIPNELEPGSLDGIQQMAVDLQTFKNNNMTEAEFLGVFYIRQERYTIQSLIENQTKEIADSYTIPIFTSFTKNAPTPQEARAMNMSVGEYKPNSTTAVEYYNMYLEVLDKVGEEDGE